MKRDIPTQRISEAPFEDRDATGKYVDAARKEFKECLQKLSLEIAKGAYDRKLADIAYVTRQALECQERYFQTMKGATNISGSDIEELVKNEVERQTRFYEKLKKIRERFQQLTGSWVRFFMKPPDIFNICSWDTGLTAGCIIMVGCTDFFAFPLVQARTVTYLQEKVVFVDGDCIIIRDHFLPATVEPFQFSETWATEFLQSGPASVRNVQGDFPLAKKATVYGNFLHLDSEQTFSQKELAAIREKYGVVAIVKDDSNNRSAFIYTGIDDIPLHIRLELLP